MSYLRYLNYIFWHKIYVYREGRKRGVDRWLLIVHDLSKFERSEFAPYRRHFYAGSPDKGRGPGSPTYDTFMAAFNLHWQRNPHHWEFWTTWSPDGDGRTVPSHPAREIPLMYAREMLADWDGTGMSKSGKNDTVEFYVKNRHRMILHPMTREWIESQLGVSKR
jgi:hypothetical protein